MTGGITLTERPIINFVHRVIWMLGVPYFIGVGIYAFERLDVSYFVATFFAFFLSFSMAMSGLIPSAWMERPEGVK
mgnify:CR=1 FL=1